MWIAASIDFRENINYMVKNYKTLIIQIIKFFQKILDA